MSELREFLRELEDRNCRGVVVVESPDVVQLAKELTERASGDKVLYMSSRDKEAQRVIEEVYGLDYVEITRAPRVLGREYKYVLLDLTRFEKLSPNTLCIVAETIKAGGALVIAVSDFEKWNPGRLGQNYAKYLKECIKKCEAHLVQLRTGQVLSQALPEYKLEKKPIQELSESQQRLYKEYQRFLESKEKVLIIRGGRGRGKTYMLGYIAADLILRFKYPLLDVYTPEGVFTESFTKAVEHVFQTRLGCSVTVTHRVIRTYDFAIRAKKPYEKVETPVILVDEAGRLGVARVRKFLSRAYKVIMTLTTFGYEGCGKAFEYLLISELQKQGLSISVELIEPIRYCEGDPLEKWLTETFFLTTSSTIQDYFTKQEVNLSELVFEEVDRAKISENRELLKQIAEILRDAHYKHTPDDVEVLLDSPEHRLFMLRRGDEVVAVAQVRIEKPKKTEVKKAVSGVILAGLALTTLLARYASLGLGALTIWRIYRIAVKPAYQRRGVGSLLLRKIEEVAEKEKVDIIGALFSRPEVTHFWVKNGYKVFYISPRFNRVTGEHNVGVVKGLTDRGKHVVKLALQDFKRRLVMLASSVYREIDGELLAEILMTLDVTCPLKIGISSHAQRRAEIFLKHFDNYDIEFVQDVVYAKLVEHITCNEKISIPPREFLALVVKVLQGKSVKEVAACLKTGLETARKILKRAALYVLQPEQAV